MMDVNLKQAKYGDGGRKGRSCTTCLYLEEEEGNSGREKCLRFARFVDHMLSTNTRDCEYWQMVHRQTT